MSGTSASPGSGALPLRSWSGLALLALLVGATLAAPPIPAASAPAAAWAIAPSPDAGFATARLSAVTCVSATECWAVGNSLPGASTFATMAHWTGGAWSLVPSPSQAGKLTYLYDVACASAQECFAVGLISNAGDVFGGAALYVHSVIFQWDGQAWTLLEQPFRYTDGHGAPADGASVLRSVACPAPGDCWAVGFLRQGGPTHNLFEHWDGHAWTRAGVGAALDADNLELGSLSCPSPSFCLAVGPVRDRSVVSSPRAASAARWDGTAWTEAPAPAGHPLDGLVPSSPATFQPWLNGVSCASATDCWAVGDADVDGGLGATTLPLVDHWDGAAWTSTVLPQAPLAVPAAPGGVESHLTAVSCSSASDCWAVGHGNNAATVPGAVDQDFTLHWDGRAWLPGPALPDPTATFDGDLASIACPTASLCWAVGQITPAGQVHGLVEQWNGASWAAVAAPAAGATVGNYLHDVACPAPSDCWAVGFDFYGQLGRTLVLHGDGSSWAIVDSPNSAVDRYNELSGVSCASPTDCWAVGSSSTWLRQDIQPLALHWDGAAWTVATALPAMDQLTTAINGAQSTAYVVEDAALESVHCVALDDCWAVGFLDAAAGSPGNFLLGATLYSKPLFLHWDGRAWMPMPGPPTQVEPLTEYNLNDVTCLSSSDCTAVGSQFARLEYNFAVGPDAQTLIDHWDGHAWTAVASPNEGDYINQLLDVTCAAPDCWAVGLSYVDYPYSGTPRTAPLALHRGADGTWASVALPDGTAPLDGVACVAADDCWAAGSPPALTVPTRTTALHWDGTAWGAVPTPSMQSEGKPTPNHLVRLACTATNRCWGVGNFDTGKPPNMQTLVLRYAPVPCPDASAPPCSTTSTSTSATTSSTSATATGSSSTAPDTGSAGGTVSNVAPVIDSFAATPSTAILGRDGHVALSGAAHDDNGWESVTAVTATLHGASGPLATATAPGQDGIAGTFTADLAVGDLSPGTYQVDALAQDDQGAQSAVVPVTVTVLPPSQVKVGYTGGAPRLDFGAFAPGAALVGSQNAFQVTNGLHSDQEFFFDMADFACARGAIPVLGNAQVLVGSLDASGTFQEVQRLAYRQSALSLGTLADGATLTVKLVLEQVPLGLAGDCTSSFGLFHT